jgi:hypothetical protein
VTVLNQIVTLSGNLLSGQVGAPHIASGAVRSGQLAVTGTPDGTKFLRDDFTWAAAGGGLVSGTVGSGYLASGSVQGFFGATRHIASGTVGVFDFGSGAVVAGSVGSGAVQSGNIGSGQIGVRHHADYSVTSGAHASGSVMGSLISGLTRHVASGTLGPFDLASGTIFAGAGIGVTVAASGITLTNLSGSAVSLVSGSVQSGNIASGAVQGFFGATRHIASGTLGVFDFGSGAVVAGSVGSGAVTSGNVASGQVGTFHIADAAITAAKMASGSVVSGNIASGQIGNNHLAAYAVTSGANASGSVMGALISGLTWHIASGTVGPFDLASGTIFAGAGIGVSIAASGITLTNLSGTGGAAGNLSGTVHNLSPVFSGGGLISEEIISGVRAVTISQSGNVRIAMASVSGRMPAVGVVIDNVASGIQCQSFTNGVFAFSSGLVNFSGLDSTILVGRSGQLVVLSGWFASGGFLSGDVLQVVGVGINSGTAVIDIDPTTVQRTSG